MLVQNSVNFLGVFEHHHLTIFGSAVFIKTLVVFPQLFICVPAYRTVQCWYPWITKNHNIYLKFTS